jgi:hypothetical protein
MRQGLSQRKAGFSSGMYCSLRKDESSLNFTMLLRLESLFPFSFSPPLAGGNITILLGVILLDLDSCIMPVFQTLGILES